MQSQIIVALNFCLSKAGFTGLSGAATTFTTANAVTFSNNGKAYSKAAVSGGASPTTDAVTGNAITLTANKGTAVLWCLDVSGNYKAVQGSTETLDASGNFLSGAPQFPILPDTLTPVGYSIHKAGATTSGTWTFGVSNWNATGMSHAVQDLICLPGRPQTA